MIENQTLSEKIISAHAGRRVKPGEIVIVNVDGTMSHDAGTPYIIKAFEAIGGKFVWNPQKVTLVIDHAAPAPNERIARLHRMMRDFAAENDIRLFEAGEGICHQVMVEERIVRPGDLILGGDSHTCTYGALGAFAVGVGSTDLAGAWLTGQTWLKVPVSHAVILRGTLSPGVFSKDIALSLTGRLGMSGAVYQVLEFAGDALQQMSLSDRMTLANMVAETGAKTGILPNFPGADDPEPLRPDKNAAYAAVHEVDLSVLKPQISLPHAPDQILPIDRVQGRKVNVAFIGTCCNGRLEDLQAAATILKGRQIAKAVRLLIAPASRRVFSQAASNGTVEALSNAGATFLPPCCGPCAGTHLGVPGDQETVISSGNRNFPGRMGNRKANIYLGSPAVVAAAALCGELTDPRPFFEATE